MVIEKIVDTKVKMDTWQNKAKGIAGVIIGVILLIVGVVLAIIYGNLSLLLLSLFGVVLIIFSYFSVKHARQTAERNLFRTKIRNR
tara:strand:+ start:1491 stop:1748 length:258 start_codon:yes stop_codon:yes gene_type:complete